eukprot:g67357.t1
MKILVAPTGIELATGPRCVQAQRRLFEPCAIFRRALFAVAEVVLHDNLERSKTLILLCVLFLLIHILVKPYAWAIYSAAEVVSLVMLTLIATLCTGFEGHDIPESTQVLIFALVLLTVLFILFCHFFPERLWPSVVKQTVVDFFGVKALRQNDPETKPEISVMEEGSCRGIELELSAQPDTSKMTPSRVRAFTEPSRPFPAAGSEIKLPAQGWKIKPPSAEKPIELKSLRTGARGAAASPLTKLDLLEEMLQPSEHHFEELIQPVRPNSESLQLSEDHLQLIQPVRPNSESLQLSEDDLQESFQLRERTEASASNSRKLSRQRSPLLSLTPLRDHDGGAPYTNLWREV